MSNASPWSKPVIISGATLLGIYAAASAVSIWIFHTTREIGVSLAHDPPLYSMREDVILGACLGSGLMLYVGFLLVFFRRHLKEIFPVIIGILTFFTYPIVWATIIYVGSRELFDSRNAKVPWQTFEEYLRIRGYVTWTTLLVFVALVFLWRFAKGRGKTNR